MKKSLTELEKLNKRSDIQKMFRSAKKISVKGLILLFQENGLVYNRIAIFTKRGFKNAVARNRQKRILREIYRDKKQTLKTGFDFILILAPGIYTYAGVSDFFLKILKRGNLLLEKDGF